MMAEDSSCWLSIRSQKLMGFLSKTKHCDCKRILFAMQCGRNLQRNPDMCTFEK